MIFVSDSISDIMLPAVRAVFKEGEVSAISVRFDPNLDGGSMVLTLTAMGEAFSDAFMEGNVDHYGVGDWRERLRSNLADFVAESRFGWGQNRGV